ncbi:metallophosphoesterase [bacterium]|jgi:hypothetical protein|nr:hypothetical protein [Planctomicrobium sp.]MDB4731706.1 metallophosphoesterase [bacterium]
MESIKLSYLRSYLLLALSLLACGNTCVAEEQDSPRKNIVFYAMGDVPYAPEEDQLLPIQIAEIPEEEAAFVVHLGDIKRGLPPCHDSIYEKVDKMLQESKHPVFIIPGDNEWNDCLFPAEAWKNWERHFMRFEQNWQHQLPVFRQLSREENFALTLDGVLFVGINLVGGRVHDAEEWTTRHAQNVEWVQQNIERSQKELRAMVIFGHALPKPIHDDFFGPLVKAARRYGVPVLYMHGDGHTWIKDRPFQVKNILRVQVDQGGKAPPLKVTITHNPVEPFVFDRRMAEPPTSESK